MTCKHERIKSVNCRIEEQKAAETPENHVKTETKKTTRKKVTK